MDTDRYFNIGLPQLPTNTDPKVEPDLRDIYNALRNLTASVGQNLGLETPLTRYRTTEQADYTIGAGKKRLYVPAFEAIVYGEIVNVFDDSGVLSAQLADATDDTKPGSGISNTPGTTAIGDMVEVVFPGAYITSIGGMDIGVLYYLSTTPGAVQNIPPAGGGNIRQAVGLAISEDEMFFNLSYQFQIV